MSVPCRLTDSRFAEVIASLLYTDTGRLLSGNLWYDREIVDPTASDPGRASLSSATGGTRGVPPVACTGDGPAYGPARVFPGSGPKKRVGDPTDVPSTERRALASLHRTHMRSYLVPFHGLEWSDPSMIVQKSGVPPRRSRPIRRRPRSFARARAPARRRRLAIGA